MGFALLDKRLIFVTGKGGVGKSTVALALGVLAARRGKRVVVAELAGNDELQRTFGLAGGAHFSEVQLAPRLFTISVDSQRAMEEYLSVKLPGPAGVALAQSKLFSAFAMATPGMRELLTIGKVWELAQPDRRTRDADGYDLVIVDAPATGHGVGILRTPRTFAEIARVGPIAHQATRIATTISDRDFTGVIAVARPEEMPVNETLQLDDELRKDALALDAVILNCLYADRFADGDVELLKRARAGSAADPAATSALDAALSQHTRRSNQIAQEVRLREAFAEKLLTLPYLFVPQINRDGVQALAETLDRAIA